MKNVINKLAAKEKVDSGTIKNSLADGTAVIPLNFKRTSINYPSIIGKGYSVKVNANIGASPDFYNIEDELIKLDAVLDSGADTVMDLTIGEGWERVLEAILERSSIPVGTVPVYGAICKRKNLTELSADDMLSVIAKQAQMGVDFMTVHCGVTSSVAELFASNGRLGGIVSRGGKLLYKWMRRNQKENPLYERFDEILDIASEFNVTLSLGDGLRPGCLKDASDDLQYSELRVLGELVQRCRDRNVSVMVEGPGHVPLHKIKENIELQKELCKGAPFYILGPLTTDLGAGHDHITGAIGGAFAAWLGADFLCYLTPAEHLHLPNEEDVRSGVIASKIAAHSADIARGLPGAIERDNAMSLARKNLDWDLMEEYALDKRAVRRSREEYPHRQDNACTMCGEYCSLLEEDLT